MHLLSNSLMLAGLGGPMEAKYGSWRIAVLAALSVFGGNLFRCGLRGAGLLNACTPAWLPLIASCTPGLTKSCACSAPHPAPPAAL